MNNSLLETLKKLKGNPRACVYTEPLWGLSINLCLPYASVYMLALGMNDSQIGLIATLYMLSQALFAFLGGTITDRMGRRNATLIFDFAAWSVPCIIWWRAEGFWFFFVAALINGSQKVSAISWDCLLIEDAEKDKITGIYSLVGIGVQFSALFAPITAVLFSKFTLVPAIRILYINGFIVMTAKVLLLYFFSKETRIGQVRMKESREKTFFSIAADYAKVLGIIGKSKGMIFSLVITTLVGVVGVINTSFWQVIASKKLFVADSLLPLFMVLRSLVAIAFLFLVVPRLTRGVLKLPLLTGFVSYFTGQLLLVLTPAEGALKYIVLCISLVFDGFGSGSLVMLASALVALHVNPSERAGILATQHMIIMAFTAPFGWIAGILSDISRNFPFVLNLCLLLAGLFATLFYYARNPNLAKETREAGAET